MGTVKFLPESREQWLNLRKQDITSTESSALFGKNPRTTPFELAQTKLGAIELGDEENERMEVGSLMEPVIAELFSRRFGVKVRKLDVYMRVVDSKMGSSFDYEVYDLVSGVNVKDASVRAMLDKYGPGIVECKNVDGIVYRNDWNKGDDAEASDHIEFQVQHQLHVAKDEFQWAAIVALVNGNTLHNIVRRRLPNVGSAIEARVSSFWEKLKFGILPPVTLPDDYEAVRSIYGTSDPGFLIDASNTSPEVIQQIEQQCELYLEAHERLKAADDDKKSAMARILPLVGSAEKGFLSRFKFSSWNVDPYEYTAKNPGFRGMRITRLKERKK